MKSEDGLATLLLRYFSSSNGDKVKLLRAVLELGPVTRRQLMKKTKIERNRVYKLASELEGSDCMRAVATEPSIRGEKKLYDLTFKGAATLMANDPTMSLSKLTEKVRNLLALPIAFITPTKGLMEFSKDTIKAMLLVWAKYWLNQPFAPELMNKIVGLERYVMSQFWAVMMEMALNSRAKGVSIMRQLEDLGLTEDDTKELLPLIHRQLVRDKENCKIIEDEFPRRKRNGD